jgi:hypothetical protein
MPHEPFATVHGCYDSSMTKTELCLNTNLLPSFLPVLKRARAFTSIFATMLRREFYHTSQVLLVWQSKKLPLLSQVVQNLLSLAFACDLSPSLKNQSGRMVVGASESSEWTKSFKSKGSSLNQRFAWRIDLLLKQVVVAFNSNPFSITGTVKRGIALQLVDAQRGLNEMVVVFDEWIREIEVTVPCDSPVVPLRSVLSERLRNHYGFDKQLRGISNYFTPNADPINLCLQTRVVALRGLFELAVGENNFVRVDRIREVVEQVHDAALNCFPTSSFDVPTTLLELARESIKWRRELFRSSSVQPLFDQRDRKDQDTHVEAAVVPTTDWFYGTAAKRIFAPDSIWSYVSSSFALDDQSLSSRYRLNRVESQNQADVSIEKTNDASMDKDRNPIPELDMQGTQLTVRVHTASQVDLNYFRALELAVGTTCLVAQARDSIENRLRRTNYKIAVLNGIDCGLVETRCSFIEAIESNDASLLELSGRMADRLAVFAEQVNEEKVARHERRTSAFLDHWQQIIGGGSSARSKQVDFTLPNDLNPRDLNPHFPKFGFTASTFSNLPSLAQSDWEVAV